MTLFYRKNTPDNQDIIFGKDKTTGIVSVEVRGDELRLFRQVDGEIIEETRPMTYWLVNPTGNDARFSKLEGDLHYKFIKTYSNEIAWQNERKNVYPYSFSVWNRAEQAMIYEGITYFKSLKVEDVTVLSFDIESAGTMTHKYKETFIIGNTLYKNGELIRKQFSSDDFAGG